MADDCAYSAEVVLWWEGRVEKVPLEDTGWENYFVKRAGLSVSYNKDT